MKAVLVRGYGDVNQLSYGDTPDLKPGPGEVLVRMAATSINPIDWKLRLGELKAFMPLQFPAILGRDLAGEVVGLGDGVKTRKIGERVLGLVNHAYAEYVLCKADDLALIPSGISFEQAVENGLNRLLSVIQASTPGVGILGRVNLTLEGRRAFTNIRPSLPEILSISRCMLWQNLIPTRIFYGLGEICGASAVQIGKGMFIHNGMMSVDLGYGISAEADQVLGQVTTALLLATITLPPLGPISVDQIVNQIIMDIGGSLRLTIRGVPKYEKEVQDRIEDILRIKQHDFQREQISVSYAGKSYRPDFTSESLNGVVEAKLCNSGNDERNVVEEINSDIPAYKTRYSTLIFVIYDVGIIRDVATLKNDLEKQSGVHVLVIKH